MAHAESWSSLRRVHAVYGGRQSPFEFRSRNEANARSGAERRIAYGGREDRLHRPRATTRVRRDGDAANRRAWWLRDHLLSGEHRVHLVPEEPAVHGELRPLRERGLIGAAPQRA